MSLNRLHIFFILLLFSCATQKNVDNLKNDVILFDSDENFFVFDLPEEFSFLGKSDFETILPDVAVVIQKKIYNIKQSDLLYNIILLAVENNLYNIAFKKDYSIGKLYYKNSLDGKNKKLTIYLYKKFKENIKEIYFEYKNFLKNDKYFKKMQLKNYEYIKSYNFNLHMLKIFALEKNNFILTNFHIENILIIFSNTNIATEENLNSNLGESLLVDLPIAKSTSNEFLKIDWLVNYKYSDANGKILEKKDFDVENNRITLPRVFRAGKNYLVWTPKIPFDYSGLGDDSEIKIRILHLENFLKKQRVEIVRNINIPKRGFSVGINIIDLDIAGKFAGNWTETNLFTGLKNKNIRSNMFLKSSISDINDNLKIAGKNGDRYLIVGKSVVENFNSIEENFNIDVKTTVDVYDCVTSKIIYTINQQSNIRGQNQTILLKLAYTSAGIQLVDNIFNTLP